MKTGRQAKIIELINNYDIETQEELADRLNAAGYNVTQATISRDIRELRLMKIAVDKNRQKYTVLGSRKAEEAGLYEKYARVLKDGFLSMDRAGNILVVKTVSGMAMAVCAALDSLQINGIVGSIAGDDTIMCAIRDEAGVERVMEKIRQLIGTVPES